MAGVTLKFYNPLTSPVDLYQIDFSKNERKYKTIQSEEYFEQSTYDGHSWVIRDERSQDVVMELTAESKDQTIVIENSDRYVPNKNKPVKVSFKNDQNRSVDIYWVNFGKKETFYTKLEPNSTWNINTYVSHKWIVRESDTQEFVMYAEGEYDQQRVSISQDDNVILLPDDP